MHRLALAASLAATIAAATAGGASAHGGGLPNAEIFATNNTAVITDPGDPRLDDPLRGFERKVERIIERRGGEPRGAQLLDGVFFSSDLQATTFERSREFDFFGSDDAETLDLAPDGRRLRLARAVNGVPDVALDLGDMEEIDPIVFGGAKAVTIGDLHRSGMELVDVNLKPALGSPGGDGQPHQVSVAPTATTPSRSRGDRRAR
jgi:hypothetical protein